MAAPIKKFTRLALYVFFLSLTALLSALFGGKKSDTSNGQTILVPPTPIAQADTPTYGCTGPFCNSGDQGPDSGDSDDGSDSDADGGGGGGDGGDGG